MTRPSLVMPEPAFGSVSREEGETVPLMVPEEGVFIVPLDGEVVLPVEGAFMVPVPAGFRGRVESIGAACGVGDIGCCTLGVGIGAEAAGLMGGLVVCAYAKPITPSTEPAATVAAMSLVAFMDYSWER